MNITTTLAKLGWQPFFQQQLLFEELDSSIPARIIEQHKTIIEVSTESGSKTINLSNSMPPLTVGDWILLDENDNFHEYWNVKAASKEKLQVKYLQSN